MKRNNLFYYLAPAFRVSLFIFLCFICLLPFALIADWGVLPPAPNRLLADISAQVSMVIVVLSALLMMFRIFPHLDYYVVFIRKRAWLSGFAKGTLIGGLLILLCAAILYLNGNVVFEKRTIELGPTLLYLLYFLLVAVFEELLFRSYPLQAFGERYPLWFAIFFNSLLFALAHYGNDGFTLVAMLNIALVGILLCVYTLQKQQIAWAMGIHLGWNFVQGVVLGYPVSGYEMPGAAKAVPIGAGYLSGGSFGIEGSLFCTALLLAVLFWLFLKNGLGHIEIYDPQVVINPRDEEN